MIEELLYMELTHSSLRSICSLRQSCDSSFLGLEQIPSVLFMHPDVQAAYVIYVSIQMSISSVPELSVKFEYQMAYFCSK